MKEVFSKSNFPSALGPPPEASAKGGGNIYNWQDADTTFNVPQDGDYVIAITASAKNAAQKNSTDDDDLRVVIDGYEFGKQEVHQDRVSWKGFGVAASWDGASLQGGSKTAYFFMQLASGEHTIQFWADETPEIHEIRVLRIEEPKEGAVEDVIFDFHEEAPRAKVDVRGIPWKAFIFTPGFNVVRLADITAVAQSGKQKGGTDGDNIKVYVNGQIVRNPKAPTSDKYKNFFFSGDLSQGKKETLMIPGRDFLFNDQDVSIELWYDETPVLETVKFELDARTAYHQPNTLKRRTINAVEAFGLPVDLWDTWSTIIVFVAESRSVAIQYAQDHDFTRIDEEGVVRALVEDNEPDALRHFMWNVLLTQTIGAEAANIITTHHEILWMEVSNKKELSRSNVQDLWNNKQGREFAAKYPNKGYLELFETAKSEGKLILRLEDVTEEHREVAEEIINNMQ